ncbi:acyl-CoA thioesterase II [Paraphaeosphaeria sporulosa]
MLGHFYGATRSSVPLDLKVTALRDTRGFATRQVIVSQPTTDIAGKTRTTSVILVDFIAKAQDRTMLSFSAQPRISPLTHHSKLQDMHEKLQIDAENGSIDKRKLAFMMPSFDLLNIWHNRYCPEGVLAQRSVGMRLDKETTQDSLPHAEKASYDWIQLREKLPLAHSTSKDDTGTLLPPTTSATSACLFAHFLDTWTSVVAPWWAKIGPEEAQVYATLDFALRFHVDELDAGQWHLREQTALAAGDERDHVQVGLWREGGEGKGEMEMVASMTQTCALKGPKGAKAKI